MQEPQERSEESEQATPKQVLPPNSDRNKQFARPGQEKRG